MFKVGLTLTHLMHPYLHCSRQRRLGDADAEKVSEKFESWFGTCGFPDDSAENQTASVKKRPAALANKNDALKDGNVDADDDDDIDPTPPAPKEKSKHELNVMELCKHSRKLGATLARIVTARVRTKSTRLSREILKDLKKKEREGETLRKTINVMVARGLEISPKELTTQLKLIKTFIQKAADIVNKTKGLDK